MTLQDHEAKAPRLGEGVGEAQILVAAHLGQAIEDELTILLKYSLDL